MSVAVRVAVVGATGQVGPVMRSVLVERSFPVDEIRFLASARSAGTRLEWDGDQIAVEDAPTADYDGHRRRADGGGQVRVARARSARWLRRGRSSSTTPRRGGWIPTCLWSCRR